MAVGDWDRRELCPDGSCTGLIGPEGTCRVCGHAAPNWGDERKRGTQDTDDDDEADDDVEDDADPIKPGTPVEIGGGEWAARTLCPDGGCVGVIGADGTCKVCGKSAAASSKAAAPADDAELEDDESDEADDYEDEDDEGHDEDEDEEDDNELAAAADQLAGVASTSEVASANALATAVTSDDSDDDSDDDDDRKLCPDGACIGVIGPDGKCKVCGKEAAA